MGVFYDVVVVEFVICIVLVFEMEGVIVVVLGCWKDYYELMGVLEIIVLIVESSDLDWFDFGVLVKIDGCMILFELLFMVFSKGCRKFFLVDGSYFFLNYWVLDCLWELIEECGELDEWEIGLWISCYQIDFWEEFEDFVDEVLFVVIWWVMVEGFWQVELVFVVLVLSGLCVEFCLYQKDGLDWFVFFWSYCFGGILVDDMGLGKMLQLFVFLMYV